MLLHELLMSHCDLSPDRPAVLCQGRIYTFFDLKEAATRSRAFLKARGIGKGSTVAIIAASSFDALASLLGTLMCGAMYVPLSPDYPVEKADAVLSSLKPDLILIQKKSEVRWRYCFPTVSLELIKEFNGTDGGVSVAIEDNDRAYTIFTSGTTGAPKGIIMTHRSAMTYLIAIRELNLASSEDVLVSLSPFQFDLSLIDLAVAIGSGACVAFYSRSQVHLPKRFLEDTARHGATLISATPSLWSIIRQAGALAHARHFRHIIAAGEAFPSYALDGIQSTLDQAELVNIYGQSESIACMAYVVKFGDLVSGERIPIGEPVAGFAVRIVEPNDGCVLDGSGVGELHISGSGLFDGYFGDPQSTAKVFVFDRDGTKWFKTGDLCRRDERGLYTFWKRLDKQIQVNGFRVELDEIERFFLNMEGVRNVLALVESGTISVYLESDDTNIVSKARNNVTALPHYMRPRYIVANGCFPMTSGGKVDVRALRSEEV